jgi:uncharacterized protein (DUF58 family)
MIPLMFLFVLAIVLMRSELIYCILPGFLAILSALLIAPKGVKISVELPKNEYFQGEVCKAKLRVEVPFGIGVVFVRLKIPEEFEAVSDNTHAWFQIFKLRRVIHVEFRCSKRGYYTIYAEAKVSDILGRVVGYHRSNDVEINVKPLTANIKRMRFKKSKTKVKLPQTGVARLGIITTDFKEVRQYSNDPFKFINWKATAKYLEILSLPLVNEFEREGRKTIFIVVDNRNVEGTNIENSFEFSIQLALAISHACIRNGYNVGVYLTGSEKIVIPSSGKQQFYKILRYFLNGSGVNTEKATSFEAFMRSKRRMIVEFNPLVILITNLDDSIANEIVRTSKKFGWVKTTVINVIPYDFLKGEAVELMKARSKILARRVSRNTRVINWNPAKVKVAKMIEVMV